jgi:hypothetical protein
MPKWVSKTIKLDKIHAIVTIVEAIPTASGPSILAVKTQNKKVRSEGKSVLKEVNHMLAPTFDISVLKSRPHETPFYGCLSWK